jgi:SAM-dependent methyltransferase
VTSTSRSLATRVSDSVEQRGVVGTIRAGLRAVLHPILDHQRVIDYRERRFDRRFGVTTAGIIPKEHLEVSGPSAAHVTHYQAAQPIHIEGVVGELGIEYAKYTFVDFGCGKGKAILLASSFPFERIVGLELSPELAEIAAANVRTYHSRRQRCHAIEVLCMDALDYELPARPLVCFFYNPFGEAILERVIEKIGRSLSEHPRDVIVVYLHPALERLFRDRSFLDPIKTRDWVCVYRSRSTGRSR